MTTYSYILLLFDGGVKGFIFQEDFSQNDIGLTEIERHNDEKVFSKRRSACPFSWASWQLR
ncbi:hypothetical protein JS44_13435 [Anoxybacillus flavithermus]|uniref:Uncharacterized protein n=1 Tax=Anoxybacillus flavithermus TaxID=33934 RepID=A0A094IYR8_9BACL|nr:hypothetical protein JS44_13435 [Anoxybacillus flavithermus]